MSLKVCFYVSDVFKLCLQLAELSLKKKKKNRLNKTTKSLQFSAPLTLQVKFFTMHKSYK